MASRLTRFTDLLGDPPGVGCRAAGAGRLAAGRVTAGRGTAGVAETVGVAGGLSDGVGEGGASDSDSQSSWEMVSRSAETEA